jgi:uncharacterized membrane protein
VLIVFALAAAVLYGSADFLGGTASRRASALPVVATSAPAGALVMLVAVLVAGGPATPGGLLWAALGGGIGGGGLIVFYAGLAAGPMSVVAPVSALVSTVVPVAVAVAAGERPGLSVYAGVLVCLVAVGLVSLEPRGQRVRHPRPGSHPALRGLAYGSASGLAFGMFFVFLKYAGTGGVFWPVFSARLAGTSVVLVAAVIAGARPVWWNAGPRVFCAAAGSGLLDACANVAYVLATRAGLFGIAVILTSLYPGITVLLARVVHGERMHLVQRAGLLLAAAGVALVTV